MITKFDFRLPSWEGRGVPHFIGKTENSYRTLKFGAIFVQWSVKEMVHAILTYEPRRFVWETPGQ